MRQVLKIAGLPDAKPQYTHVRISNTKEQVDMALAEATIIGNEMAIELLPNLTQEQKKQAKAALMAESATRETVDDGEEEEDGSR